MKHNKPINGKTIFALKKKQLSNSDKCRKKI